MNPVWIAIRELNPVTSLPYGLSHQYVGLTGYRSGVDQYPTTTLIASKKIKLRRPVQAIYEHKIWVLLDIDQVMIDIQSWRETD